MSRHVTPCHVMSRYVTPCNVMVRPAMSRPATSCHVRSRLVTSCHVMLRCVTSCHITSCHVLSRHVTSCHVMPRWLSRRVPISYRISGIYFFIFFFFFYSPFVLRNYSTDSHQILRNCVFWCSSNNPIVLKFFWRHLADKPPKTAKTWSKFHGLTQIFDNNFKTVKDNSNLKQIWTRGIVSLHFWQISFRMVRGQLRSICPIGWENLYFVRLLYFHCSLENYSTDFHKTAK